MSLHLQVLSEIHRILISRYTVTRWHLRERPPYCVFWSLNHSILTSMKNLESRYSWFSWRWMWAEKLLGYLENFWFFDKNWTKKGWACKMIEWFLETFIRLWGNVIHIGLYKTKIACRTACLGYCLHAVYKINLCSWKWHPVTCKEGERKCRQLTSLGDHS